MNLLDRIKVRNLKLVLGLMAIPMFAVGFLLPEMENGYPWCIDTSFVAASFILLGISLREKVLAFAQSKAWVLALFTVGSAVVLAFGTLMRGDNLDLVLMCKNDYGNLFWFMINAFSGSTVVLGVSMLIFRISREGKRPFSTNAITYMGQHTMGIYLLHKNLQLDLIIPWIHTWLEGPQLLVACIATCISLAAALLLCAVIERYVPQLLGQFPRYPTTSDESV